MTRMQEESEAVPFGNGGELVVEVEELSIADGGIISVETAGPGRAGSVTIFAEDIQISGQGRSDVPTGILASSSGTGTAGTIRIDTDRLAVRDRGEISASSDNAGVAGNVEVVADRVFLDNGLLSATAVEGDRGNITLEISDLQLRHGSEIVTNARREATGGNISIVTDTLVALENSDIAANSEANFGGRVFIGAESLFGTEFRSFQTPESDITATSALGEEFSGVVEINTPDIDSTSGLYELRTETIDAAAIAFNDCREYEGSEFYYTGNGGIPENPRQFLEVQTPLEDLGELEPFPENREEVNSSSFIPHPSSLPQEATSWTIAPDGKIALVSQVSTAATLPQPSCN